MCQKLRLVKRPFRSRSRQCGLIFFEVTLQDSWYFGLLVAIYQKRKDKNMRWTGHRCTYLVEGGLKWNKVDKSGGLRERLEFPGGGSYSSNNGISEAEIENLFRIETVLICLYPHHIIVQLKASSEKKQMPSDILNRKIRYWCRLFFVRSTHSNIN